MANRAVPLRLGALALSAALAALVLGTALALALRAEGFSLRPAEWAALRFTLLQAALSALVSASLAVPLARALARRSFPGRGTLISLMGAPFILPVVVAVLGLLTVFGRSGFLSQLLGAIGLPRVSIYGLQGVVLAHVFLNLPLAVRMLLAGWQAIPAERFRLAETLGLGPGGVWRHLERPMLREVLPGAVMVIFLICLSSFVVALTLGGGPRATTLELAIYQALRFDFDLGRAAVLAGVQMLVCAISVALAAGVTRRAAMGAGLDRVSAISGPAGWRRATDAALIVLAALFLLLPLVAIAADGARGLPHLPTQVWRAAGLSLLIAIAASMLSTLGALMMALAVAEETRGRRLIELAAMLPMAASGMVLGTGLFLALRLFVAPESLAVPVTVLVNASLALPFSYRLLLPEARALRADYGRLATSLGVRGWARLRLVTLPRLARPLGLGAGLAAALSTGDLGVIALFAGEHTATLPLVVQRLMGAYRMEQAAAAALVLVMLGFGLFWICDRTGRAHAQS